MTITEVKGFGRQKGSVEMYGKTEYTAGFLPKIKVEVVLSDSALESAVYAIMKVAQTGKLGTVKYLSLLSRRLSASGQKK